MFGLFLANSSGLKPSTAVSQHRPPYGTVRQSNSIYNTVTELGSPQCQC